MDDIRRPSHQRRDFAMRHRPHHPATPPQPSQPAAPNPPDRPAHHPQPTHPPYQPHHPPAVEPDNYETGFAPAAAAETGYEHYGHPAPQARPQSAAKQRRLPKIPLKYALAGLVALILIAGGAYWFSRPAQKSGFSVAQLSSKSTFGFYYPQPLPSGYSYETKINAFQNGQAYFMLTNGSKHIIVHEQAASGGLNTSSLTKPLAVQSPAGKAAVGTQAGQPAAKVLAGSTLISINTTGPVPASDLGRIINSLRTDR